MALACAKNGASLAVAARSEAEVKAVADEAKRLYDTRVVYGSVDVVNDTAVSNFVARAERELGPLTGMICAAGVYGAIGPVDTTPPSEWRKAIDVNVIGNFNCIYAVAKGMKERRQGNIVLFSGGGQNAIPNFSSYTASKGAVWRMTETLGAELEPFGVYVNAIAPGLVNTQFLEDLLAAGPDKVGQELYDKSVKQKVEGGVPPDQAADLGLFLISGDSKNLSGKILSARWDDYRAIKDPDKYNKSDIFTVKRIMDFNGSTRF